MIKTRTLVFVTFQFSAQHCWPDAPIETSYLRNPHRHLFHVKIKLFVTHSNRDIEFIRFKDLVSAWVRGEYEGRDIGTMSCEQIAEGLLNVATGIAGDGRVVEVEVSEDGENGAILQVIAVA